MKSKGKRYNKEQIIYALGQVEGGRKIAEGCRELGVSEQTFTTVGKVNTWAWESVN